MRRRNDNYSYYAESRLWSRDYFIPSSVINTIVFKIPYTKVDRAHGRNRAFPIQDPAGQSGHPPLSSVQFAVLGHGVIRFSVSEGIWHRAKERRKELKSNL